MGYLKILLDKTELTHDDTLTSAFFKGVLEGALDCLVIVGTVDIIAGIIDYVKK